MSLRTACASVGVTLYDHCRGKPCRSVVCARRDLAALQAALDVAVLPDLNVIRGNAYALPWEARGDRLVVP